MQFFVKVHLFLPGLCISKLYPITQSWKTETHNQKIKLSRVRWNTCLTNSWEKNPLVKVKKLLLFTGVYIYLRTCMWTLLNTNFLISFTCIAATNASQLFSHNLRSPEAVAAQSAAACRADCLFVRLPVYPSVCLFNWLVVCGSACFPVSPFVRLPVYLSVCPSAYMPICLVSAKGEASLSCIFRREATAPYDRGAISHLSRQTHTHLYATQEEPIKWLVGIPLCIVLAQKYHPSPLWLFGPTDLPKLIILSIFQCKNFAV